MIRTKVCKNCKGEQWLPNFKESKNSVDGYFPFCMSCVSLIRSAQIINCGKYYSLLPFSGYAEISMTKGFVDGT